MKGLLKTEPLLVFTVPIFSELSLLRKLTLPWLFKLPPLYEFEFPEFIPFPICEPKWLPPVCGYTPVLEFETFLGEMGLSAGFCKSFPKA